MKSDSAKKGVERAPHRSLFKAMGYTDTEIGRPIIGIANSVNDIVPGHVHLDRIVEAVKAGVYMAGGTPVSFGVIGVCDGIAMNHTGMKYSLASRELIADTIEVMAAAHAFDAVPNEASLLACHAKSHTAEVYRFVARTSTEVHGGMGFTDLLGLHYWFKRIGFDRQVLGGPEAVRAEAAALQGWTKAA